MPIRQLIRDLTPYGLVKFMRDRKMHGGRSKDAGTASYQEMAVNDAAGYRPIFGADVLVVGCNDGSDCRHFVDRGAALVTGLDVIEEVGSAFQHDKVKYRQAGIEASGLPEASFDLIFSVATMEHVPDIEAGFREMGRLVRPGGVIYAHASPLWHSPYGHHMGAFQGHPWAHLGRNRAQLLSYAKMAGLKGEGKTTLAYTVWYMTNARFFNKRPANDYIRACSDLPDMEILLNRLEMESAEMLDHPMGRAAFEAGFSAVDMLSTTHRFIGRKAAQSAG